MGAYEFRNKARGKTAAEAFEKARSDAYGEYMSEHDTYEGYSGTIYEKHSFRMLKVPDGMNVEEYERQLSEQTMERPVDPRITGFNPYDDKWGDAGCIDLGDGSYLFIGLASS